MSKNIRARVTMLIEAAPRKVYSAFVEPDQLMQFWLGNSSAPLELGKSVHWHFMVEGAEIHTTAKIMEEGCRLAWDWSDGTKVSIEFEDTGGGTAVTLIHQNLLGDDDKVIEAALNATEGFAIVLADLKTWLESGTSAGITKAKAKLISMQS
jgi:uncharacterized protein YndB with AHSA1/START domain